MDLPRVSGYEVLELHDYGGCGQVFRAADAEGRVVAIKVFDDLSVSRNLLARMHQRLQADGWPQGVMPVLAERLERSPLYLVMPWVADPIEGGGWRPRSLQHLQEGLPAEQAWGLIRQLADTLSRMHACHVPHGNLKPGNLFLDDQGGLLVSDWCLGNMPGVHLFHFTDALLYQSPEQLRDNSGYLDEQGYAWDVFAFGVIAYRLLTGHFPRCSPIFDKVVPPVGQTRCDGLNADAGKVAANLESSGIESWPVAAASVLEERLREWIIRCLAIDPSERPISMVVVAAGLNQAEREVEARNQKQQLLDINRRLKHRSAVLMTALGVAVSALIIVAVLWSTSEARLSLARSRIVTEREELTAAASAAKEAQAKAIEEKRRLEEVLDLERKQNLERLEAARWIGDLLFSWAIETDRQQLPPLDGREMRLTQLERNLELFISQQSKQPALAKQVALAHLQLAEISITRGRVHEASERFALASKQFPALNLDAAMRMRLATDRLLLAQLVEGQSPKEAMSSFAEARRALSSLPRGDVDGDRLDQLLAVLDYREARLKMQLGRTEEALTQLMAATQTLNRLLTQRPDTAILRSELAECYLSSALILEDMGKMGDAREVRALAAEKLEGLRKQKPSDLKIQSDLAACYEAMANAALLAGDLDAATQRSEQALTLVASVLKERPRDEDAISLKAGLIALQAGMCLDKGSADRALERYQEAQTLLEQVIEQRSGDVMARFRLALVWWQKGRVYGYRKDVRQETELLGKARTELEALVAVSADTAAVRPEQIRRSLAYLCGDIGHSRAAAKDLQGARKAFEQSAELWKQLLVIRPKCEEYLEALEWIGQRLGELK